MGGHGVFVLAMFGKDKGGFIEGEAWPCFLVFIQLLIDVIKQIYLMIPIEMKFAILALFASHGVSFVYNYLLKGEFATAKRKDLMGSPYPRMVVMHIAIILGGIFSAMMGSPVGILLALVILKTVFDIKLHLKERRKAKSRV